MENKIIELLSEESRETKSLTIAVRNEVIEVRKLADAAMKRADTAWEEVRNSKRQSDAASELVGMTRNDINRPLWKRWFGLS